MTLHTRNSVSDPHETINLKNVNRNTFNNVKHYECKISSGSVHSSFQSKSLVEVEIIPR